MFLKNRKTISKIKRSKVTDYAALMVSDISEDGKEKSRSLAITVLSSLASLTMPMGDPRDGFFNLILTPMMDFYSLKPVSTATETS